MSAVDDLKKGIVIDTLAGDDSADASVEENTGVVIDTTGNSNENIVDLSNLTPKKNHTVVLPKEDKPNTNRNIPIKNSTARKTVNISTIATEEEKEEEEDIHISPEHDILNMDNPDSPFSQYLAREISNATEWIAEKEEEKELLEAEKADEEALDNEGGISIDATSTRSSLVDDFEEINTNNREISIEEDEDISSLLENDEEVNMSDNDINITYDDPESEIPTEEEMEAEETIEENIEEYNVVEDEILEEESSEEAEEVQEEVVEPEDITEYATEEVKEEPKEPERYDAPDDIEAETESSDEGFATQIEEEDEDEIQKANDDTADTLKHLQKLATEKLKPVSKSLDISSFTILKKPVTNVSSAFKATKARVAKWVLYNQESIVQMKEFSGAELEKLREYSENARSLDSLNRRFHLIYDHIVSPKPQSFEQWLRTTPYEDVDNYFFAIYVASFKGANYLPADCINDACKETFLSDDIAIMDMVKFTTKEGKKKFAELYQSEVTRAGKGIYCTEVVPINNAIAVSFRDPSIYNIFEIAGLDDKTRTNYASIIEYIPYIDTIYLIDSENKTLTPITYKMYADNANRTVRSKIQKFNNILSTLSIDEFGTIKAYTNALAEKVQDMYYVFPELTCPKCGNTTTETRVTAEELVFTRYQLGSLVTTSLS